MTLIGGLVIYGYAGLTHQPTEVFAGRHVGKACEQTIVQHIFILIDIVGPIKIVVRQLSTQEYLHG